MILPNIKQMNKNIYLFITNPEYFIVNSSFFTTINQYQNQMLLYAYANKWE